MNTYELSQIAVITATSFGTGLAGYALREIQLRSRPFITPIEVSGVVTKASDTVELGSV